MFSWTLLGYTIYVHKKSLRLYNVLSPLALVCLWDPVIITGLHFALSFWWRQLTVHFWCIRLYSYPIGCPKIKMSYMLSTRNGDSCFLILWIWTRFGPLVLIILFWCSKFSDLSKIQNSRAEHVCSLQFLVKYKTILCSQIYVLLIVNTTCGPWHLEQSIKFSTFWLQFFFLGKSYKRARGGLYNFVFFSWCHWPLKTLVEDKGGV